MVALAVVLGDELPVGVDLVGRRVRDRSAPKSNRARCVTEVAQLVLERRRLRVQVDEHEALPRLEADRSQPVRGRRLKSSRSSVCLARTSDPVEVVDPGVVRALEADRLAARLLGDGRPAVLADVVEARAATPSRPRTTMSGSSSTRRQEVGPGRGDVLLAADDDPVAAGTIRPLELVDRRVVISAAGQQARRPGTAADGGDLVGGERGCGGPRTISCRGCRFSPAGRSFFGSRNGMRRSGPARSRRRGPRSRAGCRARRARSGTQT